MIILGGVVIIICVGMVIGWTIITNYAHPYFTYKSIVFEPDYSRISAVDPTDLKKAAQVLTDRCEYMGCGSVTFVVTGNNQIIGEIPAYKKIDIEVLGKRLTAIGLLEFTDFGKYPLPQGTRVVSDFRHPFLPEPDGIVFHTIMTNEEIESAIVSKNNMGEYGVNFTLTEQGAKIFFEYTSNNIGSYLGILLDKIVIYSPMISSAITSGSGEIQGEFTLKSAQDLVAYLKITPLPLPLVVTEMPNGNP